MVGPREILTRWRCHRREAQLVDFADGSLPPRRRALVEQHLATCAACRSALAALREVPEVLRPMEVAPHDDDLWHHQRHDIMRAIRYRPEPTRRRFLPFAWQAGLVAMAGAVIAVAGYRLVQQPTSLPRFQDATVAQIPQHVDALDQETIVALSDVVGALVPQAELTSAGHETNDELLSGVASASAVEPGEGAIDPALHDLSDEELRTLHDLLGGVPS